MKRENPTIFFSSYIQFLHISISCTDLTRMTMAKWTTMPSSITSTGVTMPSRRPSTSNLRQSLTSRGPARKQRTSWSESTTWPYSKHSFQICKNKMKHRLFVSATGKTEWRIAMWSLFHYQNCPFSHERTAKWRLSKQTLVTVDLKIYSTSMWSLILHFEGV